MNFLTVQFSPSSCYFPLRSKYSQNSVAKHPQAVLFLRVRDQDSHPFKTKGKVVILYILTLSFWMGVTNVELVN